MRIRTFQYSRRRKGEKIETFLKRLSVAVAAFTAAFLGYALIHLSHREAPQRVAPEVQMEGLPPIGEKL